MGKGRLSSSKLMCVLWGVLFKRVGLRGGGGGLNRE